ncbi:MAG TPA: TonB-dependent receptor [Ohtaekwangia sp.]|nr:TonB-dependent receptor [Ohtaekwangia sp.]
MRNFYSLTRLGGTLVLLFCSTWMYAQTSVTGRVTSGEDGTGLPGVSIVEKGTTNGTVSDAEGNYSITVAENAVVVFSFVGFASQEVAVNGRNNISIVLQPDVTALGEVVVVGYGTQLKREITGSIAKIDGQEISNMQTTSFEAALQGKAAGVQVTQGSGLAGSGSVIRIRGIASVSANGDPLYVVDGIPITSDNFLQEANWQNGAMNNNPLAAINPADIESVEILKDAAAAGIYGSRGSNGVILITTKRGKVGQVKPVFNFSMKFGTSDPIAKPKLYNSQEWLQLRQEAWELDGNTGAVWIPGYSVVSDSPAERLAAYEAASMVNTDWWDLLTQTGIKQQYDFSTNFSKKKIRTYIGASYSDSESYIKGNNLKRYSVRANIDYAISKNFDLSLSTSYSKGINSRVRVAYTGGIGDAMSTALPIYPVYDDNGKFWRGNTATVANPIWQAGNFQGYTIDDRTINTLSLRYRPIQDLQLTISGGYDYLDQKNDQWESGILRGIYLDLDGDGVNETPENRAERDIRFVDNLNINALAEYDYKLNASSKIKVLLGAEYQQSVTSGKNNMVYLGPNVESTVYKDEGSFNDETKDESQQQYINDIKWSFLSYFLRANYALNNRYFLQGTARVDGSSRFGPNKRFGFFPVISGAWLISDEDFLAGANFLDILKLKVAYGITGNANFENNQWRGTYEVNPNPTYNNQAIRFPNKVYNPDLKWETTRNFDAGFEMGILNERINAEFSYYLKNTKDVIMNLTMPGYNGFSNFYGNVGEIKNEGVELTLNTVNIETSEFKWTTDFNIAYNTNKVLSIGGYTPDAVSGGTNDTRIVEGYPVGTNFLIRYAGVDPETGRPIYLDKDGYETFEYNEQRDRVPVGDVVPDAVGSFTNMFAYKNFDLSFMFVFVIGADIYDSSSKRQLGFLTDWNTVEDIGNRWRQPGDVAKYPRVTLDPAQHGNSKEWFNTDMVLHDGSYMRLRNISIGYSLPKETIAKIKLTNARIVFSGMNLLTFTKFPGLDPEVVRDFDNQTDRNLSPNITYLTPPQEKSYNVSLSVTF